MLGSLPEKALAIGLGASLIVSVGMNISQAFDKRDLNTEIDTLDTLINDPETGYVARLGTCRQNVSNLRQGITDQNASIAEDAARGAAAVADAANAVADAQARAAEAQRQAADILANPPKGNTVCERVEDVDRRIMGSL